jgi:hypothetical protein
LTRNLKHESIWTLLLHGTNGTDESLLAMKR